MNKLLEKYFTVIKKFLPERIVQPSVGLDIGTSSCKVVQVEPAGKSFEIVNWAIEPVVNGDTKSAVKRALEKVYLQSKSVSTSISGKGTLIRYIDMPEMPIEDLRNSIEIEADKHFPFAKDQIYTDCYMLESSKQNNQIQVLVAASKKEMVSSRIKFLESLDLKADFIGIDSLAISNIFNVFRERAQIQKETTPPLDQQNNATAILNIGHTISSLIILKNYSPFFIRDIFIGGQDLNKRISNVFAVDMKEAEEIKHNPQGRLEETQRACDSVLINLISEARLSFDYFVTKNNIPITKLILTGGSSILGGITDFFAKNLDIPVERWNPISAFSLAPHLSVDEMNKVIDQLGVALGLSLYRYD